MLHAKAHTVTWVTAGASWKNTHHVTHTEKTFPFQTLKKCLWEFHSSTVVEDIVHTVSPHRTSEATLLELFSKTSPVSACNNKLTGLFVEHVSFLFVQWKNERGNKKDRVMSFKEEPFCAKDGLQMLRGFAVISSVFAALKCLLYVAEVVIKDLMHNSGQVMVKDNDGKAKILYTQLLV